MNFLSGRHVREAALAEIAADSVARAQLSPSDRQHLDVCDRCEGLVEGHRRTMRALAGPWQFATVGEVADQRGVQRVRGGVSGGLAAGPISVPLPVAAIVALLLIGALVGTAIFAGSGPAPVSSPLAGVPVTSPSPTVTARPGATPIDTSDWVPFESAHYGLSMARPSNWTATPASLPWDLQLDQDTRFLQSTDRIASGVPAATFAAYGMALPDGMTPDTFIEAYRAPNVRDGNPRCYPDPATWEPIMIDGHEARLAQGCNYYAEAMVFVGGRVYILSGYGGLAVDRPMFDAILSTVRLHPERADDTFVGPSQAPG